MHIEHFEKCILHYFKKINRWTQLASPSSSPPSLCPWDLFRVFEVCSDAKERVGCGKQKEDTAPIQFLVKQQPRFLSLRWKTCLFGIVVSTSDCHTRSPGFDYRLYPRNFSGSMGSGTGSTLPCEDN